MATVNIAVAVSEPTESPSSAGGSGIRLDTYRKADVMALVTVAGL